MANKVNWFRENFALVLLGLVLILFFIRIAQSCNLPKDPTTKRLEEINTLIEIKLKLDSISVKEKEKEIIRLQDTIIYRNTIINKNIEKHNEEITRINNLNNDSLLIEVKKSIRYFDSLDKSGGFFIPSYSRN